MNIKKIVEGMTAKEVAEVIEQNFRSVESEKADKVNVENKFAKIDAGTVYLSKEHYERLKDEGKIDSETEYNVFEE